VVIDMHLTCPCCNARFPVESSLTDDAARRAVAAALRMPPPLGDMVLRYLGCFRPNKQALGWGRAARLIDELMELIASAEVSRNNVTRVAPMDVWRHALEETLEARDLGTLDIPLKNGHAYLEEVAWRESGRRKGRREQRTEDAARSRQHKESPDGMVSVAQLAAKAAQNAERKAVGKSAAKALKKAITEV
jgi:hypothetical protein